MNWWRSFLCKILERMLFSEKQRFTCATVILRYQKRVLNNRSLMSWTVATEVSGNKLGICLLKAITVNFPISFIFLYRKSWYQVSAWNIANSVKSFLCLRRKMFILSLVSKQLLKSCGLRFQHHLCILL